MPLAVASSTLKINPSVDADASQNILTIQVGAPLSSPGGISQFIPPQIPKAPVGTIIRFEFNVRPSNHTVTQSTFDNPCMPLAGGFDSGGVYIPRDAVHSTARFDVFVTDDTQPIWFYCKSFIPLPHCTSGMIGAVNAPTTGHTFDAFQKNAKAFYGTPGKGEGAAVGVGASALGGVVGLPSGAKVYGGFDKPLPTNATAATDASPPRTALAETTICGSPAAIAASFAPPMKLQSGVAGVIVMSLIVFLLLRLKRKMKPIAVVIYQWPEKVSEQAKW